MTSSAVGLGGRVALISGAAQGMGAACARKLGEAGAEVVTMDLQSAPGTHFAGDVTRAEDVEAAVRLATDRFRRLDILIHAAGLLHPTPLLEMSEEEWDRVVDVNLRARS